MDYKDINDKWKAFLFENTFKEDIIFNPELEKKKKKKRQHKHLSKKKANEKELIANEWEEAEEEENESLEEISAMSGGPVEGHAGGSKGPWMSKKAFKRKWA